jgi:light-regulated signal transduction histidine kinase (bacteriophytochrome)
MSTSEELEIKRLGTELERARKDLDGLAYAVSHDLRAPMRAVDGYSRILEEEYAVKLDEDGRRMLGVIRSETLRMGRLIDGMLTFSRLGRQEMNVEEIDMWELVQTVFDDLAAKETPGRDLRLNLKPIPPACGSPTMIRQLWEHLIGNSIKFTSGRDIAEIEIGSMDQGEGMREYYIRDNGAGFDMSLAGKLFGIFQRFHTEEEFPGAGIGLALVQRIVHRHGGSIQAEAQVNQGATFRFTLPQPNP